MKSHYQRRYTPAKRPARPGNPSHTYEYYKMMWQAAHPEATPAEYEAAIRRITKELGL